MKFKPHLTTQDGVIGVAWDIEEIVEKYIENLFEGRKLILNEKEQDELYTLIHKYIDDLAGCPDYSNYN